MTDVLDLFHESEYLIVYDLIQSNDFHIHMAKMDVTHTKVENNIYLIKFSRKHTGRSRRVFLDD